MGNDYYADAIAFSMYKELCRDAFVVQCADDDNFIPLMEQMLVDDGWGVLEAAIEVNTWQDNEEEWQARKEFVVDKLIEAQEESDWPEYEGRRVSLNGMINLLEELTR